MSYACQECDRLFASKPARNGHMATHRKFKGCGLCAACLSSGGEACERQSDWPCSFCKRPFGSLREVNAHERKCEIENIAAWEKKISFAALEAEVIDAALESMALFPKGRIVTDRLLAACNALVQAKEKNHGS